MKINKTHHVTSSGIVKKNPGVMSLTKAEKEEIANNALWDINNEIQMRYEERMPSIGQKTINNIIYDEALPKTLSSSEIKEIWMIIKDKVNL